MEAEDSRREVQIAWSEEPPDSNNWVWHNVPLNKACRNVYVIAQSTLTQLAMEILI